LTLFIAFGFLQGTVQYALFILGGVCAIAFVPASVAVTQDVVHPGLRATSTGLCVVIQHLFGSALGPPFIGALSDRYGLETAMQFLPLFTCLAGVLYFVGAFFYERDLARVERIKLVMED
jgi:fucose permease